MLTIFFIIHIKKYKRKLAQQHSHNRKLSIVLVIIVTTATTTRRRRQRRRRCHGNGAFYYTRIMISKIITTGEWQTVGANCKIYFYIFIRGIHKI